MKIHHDQFICERTQEYTNMMMPLGAETQNHMKKKYLAHISGPLFFTAPHSKRLQRGGPKYNEKVRLHQRELYTSFLATNFANMTGKNSFCCWGKTAVVSEEDLDPNYLLQKMFEESPFHQSLHAWSLNNKNIPKLHVDIHGKLDRKKNCEVDVGMESMRVHWHGHPIIEAIDKFFALANKIFEGIKFGEHTCRFETEPDLHGHWGGGIHTMTEQAILLGIPSIQLEIPLQVRKKLFRNDKFREAFVGVILRLYKEVIALQTEKYPRVINKNPTLAAQFMTTVDKASLEEVFSQVQQFEAKEEANLNANHI